MKEKIKISPAGNKGFTLLELTVVVFIVGMALGVVFTAIGRAYEKTIFRETTNRVYNSLKQARQIALAERVEVAFKVDAEKHSFWIEKEDKAYGMVLKIPETITVKGEPVFFFTKGNSSGGIIKISDNKGREYSIEIDPVLGTPKIKGI